MKKNKLLFFVLSIILTILFSYVTVTQVEATEKNSNNRWFLGPEWSYLTRYPKWKDMDSTVIPAENSFFMRHTSKTKVIEMTSNVSIGNEYISFEEVVGTGVARITNVGFYNGGSIDVKVSITKDSVSKEFNLGYLSSNFMNFIFDTKQGLVSEIKYEFFKTGTNTSVAIGQYMDFKNIDYNVKVELENSELLHLVSPAETQLYYNNLNKTQAILTSDILNSSGETDLFRVTSLFHKSNSITIKVAKSTAYEWALGLYYNGKPDMNIETGALEGIDSEKNVIESKDTFIQTEFVQTLPYKFNSNYYHKKMSFEIPLENNYLIYDSLKITNVNDQDVSEKFNVTQTDKGLNVTAKAETLSDSSFYDNVYKFAIKYKVDYSKEIDPTDLDEDGHYNFDTEVKRDLDEVESKVKAKTSINFNSQLTINYRVDGKPMEGIEDKVNKGFLTQKVDVMTDIKGYKLVSREPETVDLKNVLMDQTDKVVTLNYKHIDPPQIVVENTNLSIDLADSLIHLKGTITFDALDEYAYNLHLAYNDKDELVSEGAADNSGENFDLAVKLQDLKVGKMKAKLYAVDEMGNRSNEIDLAVEVFGFLQFTSPPKKSDFGVIKIPHEPTLFQSQKQQEFQISDLRGPNKQFNLKVMLTDDYQENQESDIGNHFYFKKNAEAEAEKLVKNQSISIYHGFTKPDNSQTVFDVKYDDISGLLFKSHPGMKKGNYNGKLVWILEDVPNT